MASYIDTYIRLCYEANLDDAKTLSAMTSIIKTLKFHKRKAVETAVIISERIKKGEQLDIFVYSVALIVGELSAAINEYNDRLGKK